MSDLLNGVMADARQLLMAAIGIMAIAFVIMTWARTRSLVPTLGAVLLGAIVLAGVAQLETIQGEAEQDITRYTTEGG